MRIEDAIEVFGRGFSFTRSFTHPFELHRVGPLWVMRDMPRKRPEYRNEEWLVYGVDAVQADAVIQANRRGRYTVCAFRALEEPDGPLRASFKALGYRLMTTEMFYAHALRDLAVVTCPYPIERVSGQATADRLAKATGARQILPEHLVDSPPRIRQYVARDDEELVGWVRSIVCGNSAWCSNMYVRATHRRKGIAKALMMRMLLDDKAAGLGANILLASHAGSMLYPQIGYQEIGQLLVFIKAKK